ncbi:MAG: hypothetical protein ACK553_13030 [Planctomycetota bacterium]|jgi:hypothetical protein
MDYLYYAIALGPIGLYWMMVGYLYQRPHPMLINAAQDTLLFGLGSVGLILIGPMQLFFPNAAYSILGAWTWFFLLCLYGFIVLFVSLNRRPQWTLYGANAAALRGILGRVLEEQGIEHAWHESILVVPELGIHAMVEPANVSDRAAQLTRCGRQQDIAGWHRLERLVTAKLESESSSRGGLPWMIVGIAVVAAAIGMLWLDIDKLMLAWEQL